MSSIVLTSLIALAAFGAGWLAGRSQRPTVDAVMAAQNADLRRRMDELADALLATHEGTDPRP